MSSLLYLGFSIIAFVVSFGFMFLIAPVTLGAVFSVVDTMPIADAGWAAVYETNENNAKLLINLIPTFGIFILVVKVLMVASVRGRN
jgi:hypothetical protein